MAKISKPVRPLADVNVLKQSDGSCEVIVCFMPDPEILVGEGESRAFLALDASRSLKEMYGGNDVFVVRPKYVEAVARKLGGMLCSVTKSGKTSGIYWALGPGGANTALIGEFDSAGWENATVSGAPKGTWGTGTKILPAIKYSVDVVANGAKWIMGVIITDGIIEDEQDAINYCLSVGKAIVDGKLPTIKLVLIGIGEEVDEEQLERFDDMFEGTGIDYDLWSHGMVASMQDEADILGVLYGELMTEDTIVAPTGSVQDGSGSVLANFPDGVPGKFRFVMPAGQKQFAIHASGQTITQDISEALV